jgi:hypothetical protein
MNRRTLAAAILLAGSYLCLPQRAAAIEPDTFLTQEAQKTKKNLNRGKNVDIHISGGKDSLKTTYFSVGLLAVPYNLSGVGVNVIGTAVQNHMRGLQVSGLLNACGENAYGIQVAGIANVAGNTSHGIQVGGLMNITSENANGLQVSGLMNVNSENAYGVIVSGLVNVSGENTNGVIVSGLANVTGKQANGLQVSGLMNVTGDRMQGVQISSLLNVSGHRTRGLQLAALANVSTHMNGVQLAAANACPTTVCGMQIGACNLTKMLDGAQMGVFNDCDSIGRGMQIGLLNYSGNYKVKQFGLVNLRPDTRIQWMLYGGNVGKINTAARFLNHHTYTILGVGSHYAGFDQGFSMGFTYRAGLHQPLGQRLRLSEDLGYVHIENFDAKSDCLPARTYALQGRINLEYAVAKKLAIFASGGYNLSRHYGKAGNAGHKPICEWGIILF